MTTPPDPEPSLPGFDHELAALDELARGIAGAWAPRAGAATTIGRERALLRLYGVGGLDPAGLPLAGSVVDRYVRGSPARLADGVSLAFASALVEYAIDPQQLGIDVSAGLIDLAMEARLLADRDQRVRAEEALSALVDGALARIDANRTATRDLCSVLGDPARPWISTTIRDAEAPAAALEARELAGIGFDVLRIDVPMGRELSGLLEAAGIGVERWQPTGALGGVDGASTGSGTDSDAEHVPAGSQRGLAAIRRAVDEAAATRRAYVRLASSAPPLAAPEQAVVAAFERVDLVMTDLMAEIVAHGVDPDRALADHAFAAAIHRRAGTTILVGAGPLAVGPDLASGQPSSAATRSGRALALQLLGVHLARASQLPADQIVVGAVPSFLGEERSGVAFALAEVALRRHLLAEHALWFTTETRTGTDDASALARIGGVLPGDGSVALLHVPSQGSAGRVPVDAAVGARATLDGGLLLARSRTGGVLGGVALEHARGTIGAAIVTLEALAGDGWGSIVGEEFDDPDRRRFGSDAVAERTDANDPLAGRGVGSGASENG